MPGRGKRRAGYEVDQAEAMEKVKEVYANYINGNADMQEIYDMIKAAQ